MLIISEKDADAVAIACKFLSEGKVIAFATDTVYGIAADATNSLAVEKIYHLKKRQKNKALAILLPNLTVAEKIFIFSNLAKKIAAKFFPDALTLVLKKLPTCAVKLSPLLNTNNENDDYLAFRIISKNFACDLLKKSNMILALTSANISGDQPAVAAAQISENSDLSELDLLIDGGICKENITSTIVKIDEDKIEFLRHGKIDKSLILEVLNDE